jgi:hypothetical protein
VVEAFDELWDASIAIGKGETPGGEGAAKLI